MRTLVVAMTLAMTATASAQSLLGLPLLDVVPTTVPLLDSAGKKTGTVTINRNRSYLRNLKGEHIGTIVYDREGAKAYDPSGNLLDRFPLPKD